MAPTKGDPAPGDSAARPLQVELLLAVKTYDIDFANIVHNMVFIRWLEDLRLALIAPYLELGDLLASGIGPILEQTDVRYRRAVRLGDEVVGRMWLADVGRVRWTVKAEILANGAAAVLATQRGYFVDLARFSPVRVPTALSAAWLAATAGIATTP